MKTAILRGREIADKGALHRLLASQLDFPDYYGGNLDALYDLLTAATSPITIFIEDQAELRENLGAGYYDKFLRVLKDAESPILTVKTGESFRLEDARTRLAQLQRKMRAYNHALVLLYYDGATTAPKGSAGNRAQTTGILSQELYLLSTGQDTVALLERLERHQAELTPEEARQVALLLKDIRQMQKIPMDEYVEIQRLMVEADDVWHTAKETGDFPLFEPVLERVFAAFRKIAWYCAPEMDPYDYWLDQHEEGLTREKCDAFFATLRSHIVPLLRKVQEKQQLDNRILRGCFPAAVQAKLSEYLMALIGLDPNHVALGTTEHPFTTSLGSHLDERITTHYYEEDFSYSMFSVIHEGGHALYDTGSEDSLAYTTLDGGVSMGIHESQSRFYENLLGRSRAFCDYVFPKLQELFPEQLSGCNAGDLYRAVNRAEPSLIRTEADELTYCLHVMVRYELEKRIFSGGLRVHDLPAEWNRLYKEYLGIDVPDDKHGVLQDSHWAGGNIGYFPSYALGSAYGAQFLRKMEETVDVEGCLRQGDFGPINEWNREHIWKYGRLYPPAELFRRAAGAEFSPEAYISYLENKFSELYGLS